MAPLPPVPNVIRIRLTGSDGGGAQIDNTYYLQFTGTADPTTLNTFLGIVSTSWSSAMAPHLPPTYRLTGIDIEDLTSNTGAHVAESVAIQGTSNSITELTSGAAGVLSLKEGLKYRGGHPRTYLGGMVKENLSDANTWTAAFQTAMADALATFVSQMISAAPPLLGSLKHVNVHRYGLTAGSPVLASSGRARTKSVPLTHPVVMPVTGIVMNPQVGSQRRRNQQAG